MLILSYTSSKEKEIKTWIVLSKVFDFIEVKPRLSPAA